MNFLVHCADREILLGPYNNNDFTGRTTTQTVTVKNYPWYDGWKRGPNNADGTMGDFILDDDGNVRINLHHSSMPYSA